MQIFDQITECRKALAETFDLQTVIMYGTDKPVGIMVPNDDTEIGRKAAIAYNVLADLHHLIHLGSV